MHARSYGSSLTFSLQKKDQGKLVKTIGLYPTMGSLTKDIS
jgi:hypothetical protein